MENQNSNQSYISKAESLLKKSLFQQKKLLAVPPFLVVTTLFLFTYFESKWIYDPFLVLILVVFAIGQVVALKQLFTYRKKAKKTKRLLELLQSAKVNNDLLPLLTELKSFDVKNDETEMIIQWLELGIKGEHAPVQQLLDNEYDRVTGNIKRQIASHVLLNRLTLKFGFLGTLLGLVRTFPPMKRAILSLADADGELRFIHDIAKAIDGDEYAILTTLLATGLSITIEALSIHFLERLFKNDQIILGYLHDWYLTEIYPVVQAQYSPESHQRDLLRSHADIDKKLCQVQRIVEEHVEGMSSLLVTSQKQINQTKKLQMSLDEKIEHLVNNEVEIRQIVSEQTSQSVN